MKNKTNIIDRSEILGIKLENIIFVSIQATILEHIKSSRISSPHMAGERTFLLNHFLIIQIYSRHVLICTAYVRHESAWHLRRSSGSINEAIATTCANETLQLNWGH